MNEGNTLRNNVELELKRILDQLPTETATVKLIKDSHTEVEWRIEPKNKEASQISIHLDLKLGFIDLGFGEDTTFEISNEDRYTDLPSIIDEVKVLLKSVVNGCFSESRWYKDRSLVKSVGRVDLGDKTIESYVQRHVGSTVSTKNAKQKTVVYKPYI